MVNHKQELYVGVMTGTSADAIDAALVSFKSGRPPTLCSFYQHPLDPLLRTAILELAAPGLDEIDRMGVLDRLLGREIAAAVSTLLKGAQVANSAVRAIGSHGQTIRHRPHLRPQPFTLQIGCPATIAEITAITTVSHFRQRDIAAGGEGAPLVPFAHRALFQQPGESVAVVNIGGIANITILAEDGQVTGFDTGPGNMVMDHLMMELSEGRFSYDIDGDMAAEGSVSPPLLQKLLEHPFFKRPPPRSTGREEFGSDFCHTLLSWPEISDSDRLATACELTAQTVAHSLEWLPTPPSRWLICGGGVHNHHLMARLQSLLAPHPVISTDSVGIPAQAVEAISFAILARQTLLGESNCLPSVTGANHPVTGGMITPA
ncbi:MAG: anhydro-N-acetylmuramic acid kinase [Mariprofundales bacterium]|nr:anhydro-N-acetylmuramic acid kinase [Mariprofundales bacterium]